MQNPAEQEDVSVWDSNPARVAEMLHFIADAVDSASLGMGATPLRWLAKMGTSRELNELSDWLMGFHSEWEEKATPEDKAALADWWEHAGGLEEEAATE